MSIIDHLSVGVPDIEAGCKFYDSVLAHLGSKRVATLDRLAAYGQERVEFVIIIPFDGEVPTGGNGTHVCFVARDREAVDAFHASALELGGEDEGTPGPRPDYPAPDVYAAFVRDPFGNKLEVIHNGFSRISA